MACEKELRIKAKDYASYQSQDRKESYTSMGQAQHKLHEQCFRGKLGECIVYSHLIFSNKPCTLPNFQKGMHKNYKKDSDLMSGPNRIHVKTVQSWCLEKFGRYFLINRNDTLFNTWTEFDWFAVVLIDDIDTAKESSRILKWVRVGEVIYQGKPLPDKPEKLAIPF